MVLIDKKYTLAKMYGRMKGYEPGNTFKEKLDSMTEKNLSIIIVISVSHVDHT